VHVTSVADPARVPWRVREVGTKSATSVTTQDRQHPADRSRARVVSAVPSLVGAFLAVRAKRAGAGTAATVALVINILVPIGWIALQMLMA